MLVQDVMQRQVTTVAEDETLALARQLMLWNDVRHLPVRRPADGRVTGVLSERDVLRVCVSEGTEQALALRARDVMRSPAEHIHPKAPLADAAADLSTRKLGCLVVLDAGELVGIVTVGDVLGELAQCPTRATPPTDETRTAATLMNPEPLVCHEDDLLIMAVARMTMAGVRHLCVVDGDRRVIGMLSDRDVRQSIGDPRVALMRRKLPEHVAKLRVRQARHAGARTVSQDAPLSAVVDLLLNERVGAVPVVDAEERLRGIVSYVDVLRQLGRSPEAS